MRAPNPSRPVSWQISHPRSRAKASRSACRRSNNCRWSRAIHPARRQGALLACRAVAVSVMTSCLSKPASACQSPVGVVVRVCSVVISMPPSTSRTRPDGHGGHCDSGTAGTCGGQPNRRDCGLEPSAHSAGGLPGAGPPPRRRRHGPSRWAQLRVTFIIFDRFAFDLVDQIAGPLCLRRGSDHELGVVVQRGQPAGDAGPRQSSEMSELPPVVLSLHHTRTAYHLRPRPTELLGQTRTNLDFAGALAGDVAGGVFEGFWVVHAGWAHRREEVICATSSSRAYLPELKWSKAAMPGRSSREGWPVERPASWNAVA